MDFWSQSWSKKWRQRHKDKSHTKWLLICFIWTSTACAQISVQSLLPNSCAIVATQAYSRVANAEWRAILVIRYVDPDDFLSRSHGHMFAAWQVEADGHILIYDANGTLELDAVSHDLKTIVDELMTKRQIIVLTAHFL